MLLGSADILLEDLLELLTPRQADVLRQIAVCRGPMTPDDLAFALTLDTERYRFQHQQQGPFRRSCDTTSTGLPTSRCWHPAPISRCIPGPPRW